MYEKGFLALLPMRILKNLIMWPVNSLIFYSMAWALEKGKVLRVL